MDLLTLWKIKIPTTVPLKYAPEVLQCDRFSEQDKLKDKTVVIWHILMFKKMVTDKLINTIIILTVQ